MVVLMSGKRRIDYTKDLEEVLRVLPDDPAVERLVIDSEAALSRAAEQVLLPGVHRHGSVFPWQCGEKRKS